MRVAILEGLEEIRLLRGLISIGSLLDMGLLIFFGRLLAAIAMNPRMLSPRYGRAHRLAGTAFLGYMIVGTLDARPAYGPLIPPILLPAYDVGLSLFGFVSAFSAARGFGKSAVHNKRGEASGILDERASVNVSEMIEHCFYQLLNLAQIAYLYAIRALDGRPLARACLAVSMLLPWMARSRFPVNSFSANYKTPGVGGGTPLIRFLYRMKKWQYLLYKHALLHGLNASVAVDGGALVSTSYFRTYWLCLNVAYVCEFFMQTLVKRRYMPQATMLALQQLLMVIATVFALQVLQSVLVLPALLSLGLNLCRRGRESPLMRSVSSRAAPIHMAAIQSCKARQIYDSRGNPTVEVDLVCDGVMSRASVPSGASTGAYEAVELRDGGDRYMGKGVLTAVANVNDKIAPKIIGMDPTDQTGIDNAMNELDGTPNKGTFGANAILGVSLAVAKAGAAAKGVPLYRHFADLAGNKQLMMPVPCFNVINGGSHAGNKLPFQEYFVIPTGAKSFKEGMLIGTEVYHTLSKILKKKFGGDATLIGDEGGFAPPCDSRSGIELVMEAIKLAGYEGKCTVGLDVAASEFKVKDSPAGDDARYDLGMWDAASQEIKATELMEFYANLIKDFPVVTIEDGFDEDDWPNWSAMVAKFGKDVQIVGDDLTVTNPTKIARAVEEKAANALLLKVNQIGSITEAIQAVKDAKSAGWGVMTSHRSGETEDTYIADLAVGLCTGQIKTGAPCRSERLSKYNQLLRIEEELGSDAPYAGEGFRTPLWMN